MSTPFKAQPLIIEDAQMTDVHVVASGLQLRNQHVVEESMRRNRQLRQRNMAASKRHLRQEAEIGAEFITKQSSRTRSLSLEQVEQYYGLNH